MDEARALHDAPRLHGAADFPREAHAPALGERGMQLLTSITDGIYALDAEWRFTYLNEAAQRMLAPHLENPRERFRLFSEVVSLQVWTATPEGLLDYANQDVAKRLGAISRPACWAMRGRASSTRMTCR